MLYGNQPLNHVAAGSTKQVSFHIPVLAQIAFHGSSPKAASALFQLELQPFGDLDSKPEKKYLGRLRILPAENTHFTDRRYGLLGWCREGELNPQGPKAGGF
jgi:hypothetical protein